MKDIQLPIPLVYQSDSCACVAASLSAIYCYWRGYYTRNRRVFERDFSKALKRKIDKGVGVKNILNGAASLGLKAEYESNLSIADLEFLLKNGFTVMILMQCNTRKRPIKNWKKRWDYGHAVVLVGLNDKKIFLMDPLVRNSYAWLPIKDFLGRWHTIAYKNYDQHGAVIIADKKPAIKKFPPSLVRLP